MSSCLKFCFLLDDGPKDAFKSRLCAIPGLEFPERFYRLNTGESRKGASLIIP